MFGRNDIRGADCTSILNVDVVGCVAGKCLIGKPFRKSTRVMADFSDSCIEGYQYVGSNSTCVASGV